MNLLLLSLMLGQDPVPPAPEAVVASAAEAPRTAPARLEGQVWEVDAGTRGALVEDHRVPLVELRVQLPVGSYAPWFRDQHGGEAFTAMYYDPDGSLRAKADALGVTLWFNVTQQRSIVGMSCLKRDLPAALGLVQEVLANTAYDRKELKRSQQGQTIGWKTNQKDPDFRLGQAVALALYAEGDARLGPWEEPEPIERDVDTLVATRDALLRLPGRVIGFAGDLTRAEAEGLAKGLLPPVEVAPEGLRPTYVPLLARLGDQDVELDNLTQVYFAYAREGITWTDPAYAAFRVANHVLGGHFFSRLYVALRHEGGETYGAYTRGGPAVAPEPYSLNTFTRVENREVTEAKLRRVLADFHAGGITETELEEAKSTLTGELLFDQQAPGDVLDETLWELALGLPQGFERRQVELAQRLTKTEVDAFITSFYDPKHFIMIRVVPAE